MNNFKLASRSLTRKGRGNIIKITSLGLGLAVGLVLITKVFFEYSYESFYPDADRIYHMYTFYRMGESDNKEESSFSSTPGGVVAGMAREIPQIEAATRYTPLWGAEKMLNSARELVEVADLGVILADSCLFDVFPRSMIAGDAKKTLSTPQGAIMSRSLAEKLFAKGVDAIGQVVEFESLPGRSVTIGGVFEDIPENSNFRYEMAVSMLSICEYTYDGSQNWVGNDRYQSFMKLRPGVTPEEMEAPMRAVQERHGRVEELAAAGWDIRFRLTPLLAMHRDNPEIKQANLLMLLLAVSLISIALLNYLIITLSTVFRRAREVAVHKCYGADGGDIRRQVLAETSFHIALALVAAAVLVGVFQSQVEEILRTSLAALFSWRGIAIVAGVCAVLLVVATWIPSRLFVNVPAAAVFRNFRRSSKRWKLALLGVQFAGAAAFCATLVVMWGQYRLMMNSDPGYEYENVVYADVAGTPQGQREVAIERLRAMPEVEMVSAASTMPYHGQSGNNVSLPGDNRDLFNIADLYWVDENWLPMMEIPVIEGTAFRRGVTDPSGDSEMMVNRAFAERIVEMTGWTDGVVGKTLNVSEHPARTIIGVYENFRVGAINRLEERPTVMGYAEDYANFDMSYIMVRLRRVDGETMRAVQDVLTAAMPDKRVTVNAMKNTVAGLYNNERVERNSVVLCSIITLVIVLFGLVGYLRNEISRRSAEISIRKINGAGVSDVLRLLGREILYIAVPALTAGAIASYHVARRWISGFSEQIALSPWLFVGSAAAVLVVILAVTVGATWRIARRNPVESFKAE